MPEPYDEFADYDKSEAQSGWPFIKDRLESALVGALAAGVTFVAVTLTYAIIFRGAIAFPGIRDVFIVMWKWGWLVVMFAALVGLLAGFRTLMRYLDYLWRVLTAPVQFLLWLDRSMKDGALTDRQEFWLKLLFGLFLFGVFVFLLRLMLN